MSIFDNDLEWHKHKKQARDFLSFRMQFSDGEWSAMFVDALVEHYKVRNMEVPQEVAEYQAKLRNDHL